MKIVSTACPASRNLLETVLKLLHMYSAAAVAFVAPVRNELRSAAEQVAGAATMADIYYVNLLLFSGGIGGAWAAFSEIVIQIMLEDNVDFGIKGVGIDRENRFSSKERFQEIQTARSVKYINLRPRSFS